MELRVRVEDIKAEGLSLEFVEPVEDFPVLAEMVEEGEASFLQPLTVCLRAQRTSGVVAITGTLRTRLRLACSRCLKEFDSDLEVPFELAFVEEMPSLEGFEDEEGAEVEPERVGLIPFDGEEIDLIEALQEQVVLAMPYKPLCQEACRGFCPNCGADLNGGQCECGPPEPTGKFAVLKDFKVRKP